MAASHSWGEHSNDLATGRVHRPRIDAITVAAPNTVIRIVSTQSFMSFFLQQQKLVSLPISHVYALLNDPVEMRLVVCAPTFVEGDPDERER